MNLVIISQDKKSVWDFSQCVLFIPENSIHEIYIRPYYAPNGVSIATYEDPKRTEEVLKEMINVFSKSKLLLTPKSKISLQDIEAAKKYFDKLNSEKFIVYGPDIQICSHCGHKVYRNDKVKFIDLLNKQLKIGRC